jgi:plasmid stabilization system protein ParE
MHQTILATAANVNAERDTNAILTDALEQAEAERDQLRAEVESLRGANDTLTRRNGMIEKNVAVMTDAYVLYTWLRKKCDQPSNDVVAVQMNIGHDWVTVHDLDRDLRTMIDREEP